MVIEVYLMDGKIRIRCLDEKHSFHLVSFRFIDEIIANASGVEFIDYTNQLKDNKLLEILFAK